MKKVSVIVPVYNGERYMERCLTCLTSQTLEEMEIIVINDASTDGTFEMLNVWRENHPEKIKVIHLKENKGPGGARNIGLRQATGEYIGYMDCDDTIDFTMYEKLYQKAKEEDLDVVDCAYYSEAEDGIVLSYTDDVTGVLDDDRRSRIIAGVGYSVTKIFKTSMLKENNCYFREGVIYEDLDFLIHIAKISRKVGNVKEVLYRYIDNSNSATKEQNEQKKFDDMYGVMKVLLDMDDEENLREAMEYAQLNCFACAIGMCLMNQENEKFDLVRNLRRLKEVSQGNWTGWEKNAFIKTKMPQDNQEVVRWFETLKL